MGKNDGDEDVIRPGGVVRVVSEKNDDDRDVIRPGGRMSPLRVGW